MITPIILAIFILKVTANVSFTTCKSNIKGSDSPNSCPNDNHHRKSTLDAKLPIKLPITKPANK